MSTAAILAGALWLDRRTSASPYPPVALVLGAMALLAHGAVSAQILGRPPVRADVRHRDMEAGDVDPAARGRAWRRRLALLVSALGALALALVAPFLGGDFGHFYAYAPEKYKYPIDRYTMEVKRQLDVLDRALADPQGPSGTSPADLMRDRAKVAEKLEEAELQWLDAQESLEKAGA